MQLYFQCDESRYIKLIWDKLVEIDDMDRIEGGRRGVINNKKRHLCGDRGASE